MAATVIGVFDTHAEANRARDRMVEEGIPPSAVRVSAAEGGGSTTTTTTGAAEHGGFWDWLRSLFGSDDDDYVTRTTEAARRGSCVLAVDTPDDSQVQVVERVMQENGVIDIEERAAQWRQEGWTGGRDSLASGSTDLGTAMPAATVTPHPAQTELPASEGGRTATAGDLAHPEPATAGHPLSGAASGLAATATSTSQAEPLAGDTRIPVVKEDLEVGKREETRGRVRVVTRVVQRPVEAQVSLAEEHARVERHAVDRAASEADLGAFKEETIEVTERAEVPVVAKTARVVEEVEVGKARTERTETIRDTVRETQVDVQHTPAEGTQPHPHPAQRID